MIPPPPASPLFPYTTLFRSFYLDRVDDRSCDHRNSGRSSTPGVSGLQDRKSTRLNSSHRCISYAASCLKKKILRRAVCELRINRLVVLADGRRLAVISVHVT